MNHAVFNESLGPRTVQRSEHNFDLTGPSDPDNWVVGGVVELARIVVPRSNFGKIVRIDTLVVDATTGNPISDWSNPIAFDNVFGFGLGFNQVNDSHFRAQTGQFVSYAASTSPWFRIVGTTPLITHRDWDDYRYAWGNPSNEISVPVHDQCATRLFAYCREDTEYRHRIRGRLVIEWSLAETAPGAWRAQR